MSQLGDVIVLQKSNHVERAVAVVYVGMACPSHEMIFLYEGQSLCSYKLAAFIKWEDLVKAILRGFRIFQMLFYRCVLLIFETFLLMFLGRDCHQN